MQLTLFFGSKTNERLSCVIFYCLVVIFLRECNFQSLLHVDFVASNHKSIFSLFVDLFERNEELIIQA